MKACATELFSGLKESKKEPFFGVQMGPLKRGHFTPFREGSEKGSKVEVLVCNGFSWYRVKACATESFQWTQRVQKGALLGPKWDP